MIPVKAVFINKGEQRKRLSKKTQVMIIGTHLSENLFFFVDMAQCRFKLNIDDRMAAEAQQIKFFADAVDGVAGKPAVQRCHICPFGTQHIAARTQG